MINQLPASSTQQPAPAVPIVAIGASGGGLEAMLALLANLSPATGMAYIYIQRPEILTATVLPGAEAPGDGPAGNASSETNLLTALSRATPMTVVEAEDRMPIQPNQVYVIAPEALPADVPESGSLPDLEVVDGVLTLVPARQSGPATGAGPAMNWLIDRFFIALAERQQAGAVAVLLSGTVPDGTLGMRAIRAAGGLTFAQDETARYQTMPRSAIAEGVVDRVLPPTDIARELDQLSQQLAALSQAAGANALERTDDEPIEWTDQDKDEFDRDEPTVIEELMTDDPDPSGSLADVVAGMSEQATEQDLRRIIQLLRQSTGTDFNHYKMTTIRRRIIRRMLLFRLETLGSYADYLQEDPDEVLRLYDDLLINVTTFFRDTDAMDYLQKEVLAKLLRSKTTLESLRIWVPACSTGQEAYSIAMLLLELLGDRATALSIQVFATDLSQSAVAKARIGSYTRSEVMDVSPRRLQRFFTKVDDHYRISKAVRELCVFAPHNLLKDPPFSRLDLVSCRNLLIYLDAQLQRKAIATFHYALNPSGYLLLGKSETVGPSSPFFTAIEPTYKLYARKNDTIGRALFEMNTRSVLTRSVQTGYSSRTGPNRSAPPGPVDLNGNGHPDDQLPESGQPETSGEAPQPTQSTPVPRRTRSGPPVNDMDKAVNSLLSQYVPASVVVGADLEIIQFRGATGLFLEPAPGRASLNLLKMARPALAFELRNIVQKAGQSGQPVRRSGLEMKVKDQVHYVAVEAVPFTTSGDERLFLVLFEEVTAIVTAETDAADARSRRIRQLEEELATLRDDMHSVIEEQEAAHEELQSANEEIISSNEELQSINEELETGKEEIESSNEELLTINQELQVRNDQLSEANAFSEAIFGTIREATLILTPDLRIKSANPVFYSLFGLREGETEGRLIYELASRQWDIPQLRSLLTDVATRDVDVQGYELTYAFPGVGEKVLSLNARRVVRQQEAILLAIEDITEHRRAQRLLKEREAWFQQIADTAPTLIWVADANGRFTFLNGVGQAYTGISQEEVGTNDWTRLLHEDDRVPYTQALAECFRTRQPFQTEYRLRRHDGDYRWMLENAQPTFSPSGQFTGFIGTAADVQGQKELNAELDRLVAQRTQELTEANTQLQQTNDQLQSVLNGVPAAVTLMEAVLLPGGPAGGPPIDFTTSGFNLRAQELIGGTPDTIRSKSLLELNPELRENGLFDTYVAVYETGQPAYKEVGFEIRDETRCFAFYVTQQVDNQGVVVTALDITDRKQAEEQVRKTAEALQAVLDNSPASIGLLKAIRTPSGTLTDFRVEVANQRFTELVRQPMSQLNQLMASQLVDRLWGQQTLDNLAHVVESGEPFYIEQPDRDDRWLALSVTKQDDGVVVMGLDITDLRQMQQQREDLLNRVRQSSETVEELSTLQEQVRGRGELLRMSSHDLRGSLGIIQGATDLFAFADSDEERAQMLDMIQRNVLETTRLITELLDFARLEAGQQPVQFAPFDAAELLRRLGENVRPLAEGKQLQLRVNGEESLPVEGDALLMLRIAQNIVLNALKYTNQGSITLLWGTTSPDEWFFSVADTGPGMDQALVDRLSQPGSVGAFPSGEVAGMADELMTTALNNKPLLDQTSGEGIGLVIVRQLCDLLGARLLVESQPGQGSVFRVMLPRRY